MEKVSVDMGHPEEFSVKRSMPAAAWAWRSKHQEDEHHG
jgi:hypothetical protein